MESWTKKIRALMSTVVRGPESAKGGEKEKYAAHSASLSAFSSPSNWMNEHEQEQRAKRTSLPVRGQLNTLERESAETICHFLENN